MRAVNYNSEKIFLIKRGGDLLGIEVFELNDALCFLFGDKRVDIEVDSALELADLILQIASEKLNYRCYL